MAIVYLATRVPIFNLSYEKNALDLIMPPEAYVTFEPRIDLVSLSGNTLGPSMVRLYREKNTVYADVQFPPHKGDPSQSRALLKDCYLIPTIEIQDNYNDIITHFKILELVLTGIGTPADASIKTIDSYLWSKDDSQLIN